MDSGLLARAHADGLTVIGEAHRIGLGVFQGNQGHDQVDLGGLGQVLILGDDVLQQVLADLEVVAALLEGDAENLLGLLLSGDIIGIDCYNVVIALALGFQNGQGLVGIAGGDDTVGDLRGNQLGSGHVADVAQSHPVAEGAHPVGTSCPGIGAGQGAFVQVRHVVHEAGLFQRLGQGLAHSGGGGGDMLEGGDCRHAGGFLQLLHQLPGVQGIQEVDVAGTAVENGQGQIAAVCHVDPGRLLIGVAAVF